MIQHECPATCPACGQRIQPPRKGAVREVTINGVTYYTIRQACAALGVPLSRVNDRIYRGAWTLERALTTPVTKAVRPPPGAAELGNEAQRAKRQRAKRQLESARAKRQLKHGRAVLDAWRRRTGRAAA